MPSARLMILALLFGSALAWVLTRPTRSLPPRSVGGRPTLRLAVANLMSGNRRALQASEALAALDLDLLVALEWTGGNLTGQALRSAGFAPAVSRKLPGVGGVAVLSRSKPLPPGRIVPEPLPGPCAFPVPVVRVPLGETYVAVLGMHAPPPLELCNDSTQDTLIALAGWLTDGRLNRDLPPARAGDPVVVLGDFNSLAWWEGPRAQVDAGLVDAWPSIHARPGPTWGPSPAAPSFARIDFAFVSRHLAVTDCWTLEVPGSDHRAVVAEVASKR